MSWSFAVVTDTHCGQPECKGVHNPGSGPAIPARLQALGQTLSDCDFVVHVGDVIDNGQRETAELAVEILRGWPCPVYVCLGNHDAMTPDGRAMWLDVYPEAFPGGRLWSSFEHRGLKVIVLDAWWRNRAGELLDHWLPAAGCVWKAPDEQLAWLEQELAAQPETPTIVVHHPLSMPLTARLTGTVDGHIPPEDDNAALLAILSAHPQVRCLFGGHAHAHQIEHRDGLWQVATGALCEYPYEYRRVTVDGDSLSIETVTLPPDEQMADAAELRNPWVAGQAQDRAAAIPLG